MNIEEKAAESFIKVMKSGALDGVVLYDLIDSYSVQEDDEWGLKDALRKVIRYYSSAEQYRDFEETYIES